MIGKQRAENIKPIKDMHNADLNQVGVVSILSLKK